MELKQWKKKSLLCNFILLVIVVQPKIKINFLCMDFKIYFYNVKGQYIIVILMAKGVFRLRKNKIEKSL